MSEDARRRLEDILSREIETARVLAAALEEERAALTGDSPEAVARTAAEKTQLVAAVEKLDDERRAIAAAAQQALPGTRLTASDRIAGGSRAPGTGLAASVAELWRTLIDLMAVCRRANELNGYIINLRRGQVRELLAVVRGGSALTTYTAQGKTFAKAHRALAKA